MGGCFMSKLFAAAVERPNLHSTCSEAVLCLAQRQSPRHMPLLLSTVAATLLALPL